MSLQELSDTLTSLSCIVRTPKACECRLYQLGHSTARTGWSLNRLCELFGVSYKLVRCWTRLGLLHPERTPKGYLLFSQQDIEHFIRAHGWAYDVKRMPRGALKSLASVQPKWLTLTETCRATKLKPSTLSRYLNTYPEVGAFVKRPSRNYARVRAHDVPRLLDAIDRLRGIL